MQQTNILCCLLVLLLATQASEVSYANIKAFWESTYDLDGDGKASVQDFVHYFRYSLTHLGSSNQNMTWRKNTPDPSSSSSTPILTVMLLCRSSSG